MDASTTVVSFNSSADCAGNGAMHSNYLNVYAASARINTAVGLTVFACKHCSYVGIKTSTVSSASP